MQSPEGQAGLGEPDPSTTAFFLVCSATLVGLALTEQFADLPGAVAALVSSWFLLRH